MVVEAVQARRKVLTAMLALWALPEDVLEQYLVLKKPVIQDTGADIVVGRALLPKVLPEQAQKSISKKVCFYPIQANRDSRLLRISSVSQ